MKNLKDLRLLKQAQFERINTSPKKVCLTLDEFKKAVTQNPQGLEIIEFYETNDCYGFKFKRLAKIYNPELQDFVEKEIVDKFEHIKPTELFKLMQEQKIVTITFRSKDYFYKFAEHEREVYGEDLKSENLTEKGFKVTTFDGTVILYNLINQSTLNHAQRNYSKNQQIEKRQ